MGGILLTLFIIHLRDADTVQNTNRIFLKSVATVWRLAKFLMFPAMLSNLNVAVFNSQNQLSDFQDRFSPRLSQDQRLIFLYTALNSNVSSGDQVREIYTS